MPPRRLALAAALLLALPALSLPAAAEVRFGGDARMGLLRSSDLNDDAPRWNFTSRLRLTLRAESQTDGGLTFGGQFRLDQAGRAAGDQPRSQRN